MAEKEETEETTVNQEKGDLAKNRESTVGLMNNMKSVVDEPTTTSSISKKTAMAIKVSFYASTAVIMAVFLALTIVEFTQFYYVNKNMVGIGKNSFVYYVSRENFPSLNVNNSVSFKDIQNSQEQIRSSGVSSLLIQTPNVYDYNYRLDESSLALFIKNAHLTGISVFVDWFSLGLAQPTASTRRALSGLYSAQDADNISALDFNNPETLTEVIKQLKIFTDAGVDGFVFSDPPRKVDRVTHVFSGEVDGAALDTIRKELDDETRLFPIQLFARPRTFAKYPLSSHGAELDGFLESMESAVAGKALNYTSFFQNLKSSINSYNGSSLVITTARHFADEADVSVYNFTEIMAALASIPFPVVIEPGCDYGKAFSKDFASETKDLTEQQRYTKNISDTLMKIKMKYLKIEGVSNFTIDVTYVPSIVTFFQDENKKSAGMAYFFNTMNNKSTVDLDSYGVLAPGESKQLFSTNDIDIKNKITGSKLELAPGEIIIISF